MPNWFVMHLQFLLICQIGQAGKLLLRSTLKLPCCILFPFRGFGSCGKVRHTVYHCLQQEQNASSELHIIMLNTTYQGEWFCDTLGNLFLLLLARTDGGTTTDVGGRYIDQSLQRPEGIIQSRVPKIEGTEHKKSVDEEAV